MTLLTLGADAMGIGSPGFDREQVLVLVAGIALLLCGLAGHRVSDYHRIVAINLLNLFILLFCLELGSILVLRATKLLAKLNPEETGWRVGMKLPYYAEKEWGWRYWYEHEQVVNRQHYRPWIQWDLKPFTGESINIDENGLRLTPESSCGDGAYRIFTFGASTMWGWGAPDWGTVASYLQSQVQESLDRPVCVTNFGELGYVSTQNVIQLLLELRAGNTPDLAVFYDGIADTISAFQSGSPAAHIDLQRIAARHDVKCPVVDRRRILRQSNLFLLLETWRGQPAEKRHNYATMGKDPAELASATVATYLANHSMISRLSVAYGFKHLSFWQPMLSRSKKTLHDEEQVALAELSPPFRELTDAVYDQILLAASSYENLHPITDALDSSAEPLWIDMFHVTPEGNQLIAQAMAPKVLEAHGLFETSQTLESNVTQ